MTSYHVPVLLRQSIEMLKPSALIEGSISVDCTLGGGGHSEALLRLAGESGRVIGIDQDEDAIAEAKARFAGNPAFTALQGNFSQIRELLGSIGISSVNSILMDLGVSSHQLDTAERGFSFRYGAKLDMRMDRRQELSASDIVNTYPEEQLASIFFRYGEEKFARRIASRIARARAAHPITETSQLATLVSDAIPAKMRSAHRHPATKVFQALRIAVNNELEALAAGLENAIGILAPEGLIAVITYHSLEDRIVKDVFNSKLGRCTCPKELPVCVCHPVRELELVTRHPVMPDEDEIKANPRARSAKLRVARRVGLAS